jgi:hypothetical protein
MLDLAILLGFVSIVLAPCFVGLHITATDGPADDAAA